MPTAKQTTSRIKQICLLSLHQVVFHDVKSLNKIIWKFTLRGLESIGISVVTSVSRFETRYLLVELLTSIFRVQVFGVQLNRLHESVVVSRDWCGKWDRHDHELFLIWRHDAPVKLIFQNQFNDCRPSLDSCLDVLGWKQPCIVCTEIVAEHQEMLCLWICCRAWHEKCAENQGLLMTKVWESFASFPEDPLHSWSRYLLSCTMLLPPGLRS